MVAITKSGLHFNVGLIIIVGLFGYSLQADLKPIVPVDSECSLHGVYLEGICSCNLGYEGVICQYQTVNMNSGCTLFQDCYDCAEYACTLAVRQQLSVCDYVVEERYKVKGNCRNISAACFAEYNCSDSCPEGISLLGSDCFRTELLDRFGFFMIVTAALTVFSVGFELIVHFLEHFLAHHHHKGLLGIVHGFKSELTLVGLIGLTLFIVNSNSGFEHLIETFQGSEEVIEGVHFLMFFFVIIYFFVLIFSIIVMKVIVSRRYKSFEKVHSETLQALFEGRDYKQRAREVSAQVGANSKLSRKHYANYSIFRKYFFISASTKFSREEMSFFPFNEYMNLCLSDVMGRISGGTWIIWIAFAFFFVMDVYLKPYHGYLISRIIVMVFIGVTNVLIVIPKIRMAAYASAKRKAPLNINEENIELMHENPHDVRLAKAYQGFFVFGSPKMPEIMTQISLWFSILNAFSLVFDNDASWLPVVVSIVLALFNGSYIITFMAPLLAGVLYNGPNLNVQFVKEVLKRHPQLDKIQLYREYVAQKQAAKANVPPIGEDLQDEVQE